MSDFQPASVPEVVEIVQWAADSKQKLALSGGGSKRWLGRPMAESHAVSLTKLAGIVEYESAELVLTAQAGTYLDHIEAEIAACGQMLAFEPPDWRALLGSTETRQTIGGVLSCNLAGPRRIGAGAARDHFLGFQGVNGRGEIFKAGGKVVKNVTGYDLPKLLAGSYGTLAALTEISLKVLPRPETSCTLAIFGLDDGRAIKVLSMVRNSPHEVSGAAHLPLAVAARSKLGEIASAGCAVTLLRLEGHVPSVAHRRAALQAMLKTETNMVAIDDDDSQILWREIRDVGYFADAGLLPVWRISCIPSAGPAIAAAIARAMACDAFYDWGGGLIWLRLGQDLAGAGAAVIRGILLQNGGGQASLIRAPEHLRTELDVFEPLSPAVFALAQRIKTQFDPSGLFNPGRLYRGM